MMRCSTLVALSLLTLPALVDCASAQDGGEIQVVPVVPHSLRTPSVTFSPDGTRMLSASWDATLKLWEVGSGRLIRTFLGHLGHVQSAAFSGDGAYVISGGSDKTLRLWDIESGRLVRTFEGHLEKVQSAAFSRDGKHVLSGSSDNTLKLWEVRNGHLLSTFKGHSSYVTSVAFSPDGSRVLSGSDDTTVKLWDASSGKLIRTFQGARRPPQDPLSPRTRPSTETPVAFHHDGIHVLSGSWNGTINLWDASSGRLVRTFTGHSGEVSAVAFSPDGARVVAGGRFDPVAKVWDTATGRRLLSFDTQSGWVASVAFSPDGTQMVTSGGDHEPAKLWDSSGQLVRAFSGYSKGIASIALSRDGGRVVSGGFDNLVKLWDTRTGSLIRIFEGHSDAVQSVAVSRDGSRVVSGGFDRTVKLWEANTGKLIHTLQGHSHRVWSVAFSPDGTRVLSGGDDNSLKLWDTSTGRLVRTFPAHASRVWAVAFAPDGLRVLSTSGFDGMLKLWDANNGQLIKEFRAHQERIDALDFSPDGTRVLTGSLDQTAKLWEVGTGKLIRTFQGSSVWGGSAVAFSPDGRRVLVGRGDTVTLLEADTGKVVRTFTEQSRGVSSVAFSPDGFKVFSGSNDTTIKIWSVATGEQLGMLIGGRKDEWLAITPKGYFAASAAGTDVLSAVRGLQVTSIAQFRDHLYRPDLVEEALKGDPEGKHKDEGSKLNLDKILNSGPAPQIEHIEQRTERTVGTVRLAVRITDTGGGIGERVVWRVNGKTSGNVEPDELKGTATPSAGRAVTLTGTFSIDPGKTNVIELTAYNGARLVATPPFPITVDKFGVTTEERPRMHVLAIGVDKYRMKDYQLNYAVKDAREFAKALEIVGSTLFAHVQVKTLLDEEVTEAGIAAEFERIGNVARPSDVFVLFLGGHGKSIAGRYYYYPPTLDFAAGQLVEQHGIGHDKWQAWLAKVDAQKTLLILDTCESAAAAGLVRGGESARQTAMDQLQHATGQNLIAASRHAALEGYKGHGVLTYALLEALHQQDATSGDEQVRIGSLADHVDQRVPEISQILTGISQRPTRRLADNFPIGLRRPILTSTPEGEVIEKAPTHALKRPERVRELPTADARGERELPDGYQVRVVMFDGQWALIARDGQKLGYVPADALSRLQ